MKFARTNGVADGANYQSNRTLMNKSIAILVLGATLTTISTAQVTGTFNFGSAPVAPVDTFSDHGISLTVSGLSSSTALDQSLSSVTLNASATNILVGEDSGIGTGPFSDHELRNGGGTPALAGATLLEISHISPPNHDQVTGLDIVMDSVDYSTHEGFLVYGSTGSNKLVLLDHGFGNASGIGSFDVSKSQLAAYSNFYVTADNGYYSSVLLGSCTAVTAAPAPEPFTIAGLAIGAFGLLRRRKNA